MSDREHNILSHISYFSAARYLSEALLVIRGLILARILGPVIFGIWTQMKLVLLLIQYSHLGSHDAMVREVPYFLGMGNHEHATDIKQTVFGFNLLSSALTAIVLVGILLVSQRVLSSNINILWVVFACIFFVSQIYWFFHLKLQAETEFALLSKMLFGFAFCSTVAGSLSAYYYGLGGFLLVLGLSYLLMVGYVVASHSPIPKPSWNPRLLRKLIRTGYPIMFSGALLILLWNVDKLVIWILMTKRDLGIYALISYIANTLMLLPGVVSAVLYPRVMEIYGNKENPSLLEKYLTQPTLIMSYLGCPLLGVFFLALHLPIRWILPEYALAIPPGQILILAFFFMIIARMPATILISLNRQNLLLVLTAISVLVGAIADFILIKLGYGIIGVALGTSLSFALYSSLTMISSLRTLKISRRKSISFLSMVGVPYIAVLFLLAITFGFFPVANVGWVYDCFATSAKCMVLLALMGILFFLINQRYVIVEQLAFKTRPV